MLTDETNFKYVQEAFGMVALLVPLEEKFSQRWTVEGPEGPGEGATMEEAEGIFNISKRCNFKSESHDPQVYDNTTRFIPL
jgi:hypothetical protein